MLFKLACFFKWKVRNTYFWMFFAQRLYEYTSVFRSKFQLHFLVKADILCTRIARCYNYAWFEHHRHRAEFIKILSSLFHPYKSFMRDSKLSSSHVLWFTWTHKCSIGLKNLLEYGFAPLFLYPYFVSISNSPSISFISI